MRKLLFACVSSLLFHQILYAAPSSLCLPVKSLNMYFCLLDMNSITQLPQDMDRAVTQWSTSPTEFPSLSHTYKCTQSSLRFLYGFETDWI